MDENVLKEDTNVEELDSIYIKKLSRSEAR